jgi:hypothetical protein
MNNVNTMIEDIKSGWRKAVFATVNDEASGGRDRGLPGSLSHLIGQVFHKHVP